ncbi:carbohydrate kinase family protein [Actinosynnema sp. CA-299493]
MAADTALVSAVTGARPDVVAVGGVSSDRLHLYGKQAVDTVGGAGTYAALGAAATGARVGLVGLYSDSLDDAPAAALRDRLDISGLVRVPGRELHFEITHSDDGHTRYVLDGAAAEELLTYRDIPDSYAGAAGVHLCPTGPPATQLALCEGVREDRRCAGVILSATVFGARITAAPALICRLWSAVDVLVCNAEEAVLLSGQRTATDALRWISEHRAGAVVVTFGSDGAAVVGPGSVLPVPPYRTTAVDPTGAGESFAGALLAAHATGVDLWWAAVIGAAVASITVEGIGPTGLMAAGRDEVRRRASVIAGTARRESDRV